MPGFDGTGPRGMGPMTGGGRGFCAVPLPGTPAYGVPYYGQRPAVMPFAPQISKEQELGFLKAQSQAMREQLEQIEGRIKGLEGESES